MLQELKEAIKSKLFFLYKLTIIMTVASQAKSEYACVELRNTQDPPPLPIPRRDFKDSTEQMHYLIELQKNGHTAQSITNSLKITHSNSAARVSHINRINGQEEDIYQVYAVPHPDPDVTNPYYRIFDRNPASFLAPPLNFAPVGSSAHFCVTGKEIIDIPDTTKNIKQAICNNNPLVRGHCEAEGFDLPDSTPVPSYSSTKLEL